MGSRGTYTGRRTYEDAGQHSTHYNAVGHSVTICSPTASRTGTAHTHELHNARSHGTGARRAPAATRAQTGNGATVRPLPQQRVHAERAPVRISAGHFAG